MKKIIVSDTTVLIILAKTNQSLDLHKFFGYEILLNSCLLSMFILSLVVGSRSFSNSSSLPKVLINICSYTIK
ncbi:MAG: hypothetical protein KGV43_01420 [Arcobacter sp.]|nr:hypothetical protein [Arcobacter sp.]